MTTDDLPQQGTAKVIHPSKAIVLPPKQQAFGPPLDGAEAKEKSECEKIIRQGWDTFLDVGRALATIRRKRLYRDTYGTFDEYCRHTWSFSKTHANRLIEAAEVAAVLTPIGAKLTCESQVRHLVNLTPQQIPAAWRRAEEFAGGGEITAKLVKRAAEEFKTDYSLGIGMERPNKSAVSGTRSKLVMKLIETAETAVKEMDITVALDALEHLRECILAEGQDE